MKKLILSVFFSLLIIQSQAFATVRIMLFGDSLMAGYGLTQPFHLSEILKKELANENIKSEIINASVSGDTTFGGLNRIQWSLADKPDIVILGLGANDMLRGIDPKEIKKNLEQIIILIQKQKIKIILTGLLAPESYGNNYKENFDKIYKDLAKEFNLILMPFLLEGVALNPKYNLEDGKHPNAEGVKIIASNLKPFIKKSL
jgi:acyl-CoA thioesterase-1